MGRIKIIIDTDIGGDIDDAFAICMAMHSPEVELLGVTTVYQDTEKRAKIAARLLRLGGCSDIPVVAGEKYPLKNRKVYGKTVDFDEAPITYVSDYDSEVYRQDVVAKDFIIQTLENAEEPIVLVTMGALTNIAKVFMERPDLKEKILFISMMGGAYYFRNVGEFNISCDPEAADIVINSGVEIRCVGLDVTFQQVLQQNEIQMLENHSHPCIKMLMNMRKTWGHGVVLHDPLALAVVFRKDLVVFEKILCKIELEGTYTRGVSVNLSDFTWGIPAENSRFEVGITVDSQQAVTLCLERLLSF